MLASLLLQLIGVEYEYERDNKELPGTTEGQQRDNWKGQRATRRDGTEIGQGGTGQEQCRRQRGTTKNNRGQQGDNRETTGRDNARRDATGRGQDKLGQAKDLSLIHI